VPVALDDVMADFAGVAPGPANGLTDVSGLEVGHFTRSDAPYLTGTTAVLARHGATAAVAVGGGAPATRDTDALDPRNLVDRIHAVVLSGGSAYGLDAAGGTMRWLEEQGIGRPVGLGPVEVVPLVPAAALFDLGRGGSFAARPEVSFGYAAAEAATAGAVAQGNVGAGTGALLGSLAGRRLKGGLGTASVVTANGVTVAALAVVNAVGQAIGPVTGLPYAAFLAFPGELPELLAASAEDVGRHGEGTGAMVNPSGHTVLVVVATDATLAKSEAADLARVSQDGLVRAIRPAHTRFDGDVVFALATGLRPLAEGTPVPLLGAGPGPRRGDRAGAGSGPGRATVAGNATGRDLALALVGQLAADCLSRAIVHALLAAESVGEFTAYRDAFPSVFRGEGKGDGKTDA
jgi:putative pantetheine hydrolase